MLLKIRFSKKNNTDFTNESDKEKVIQNTIFEVQDSKNREIISFGVISYTDEQVILLIFFIQYFFLICQILNVMYGVFVF